jgi:MipA family protein
MRPFVKGALVILATASISLALMGQEGPLDGPKEGWSVTTGAMLVSSPSSTGSDQQRRMGFPILNIAYGRFSLGGNPAVNGFGLGVRAIQTKPLSCDFGLGYTEGRKEHRADVLAGMGDQGGALWAGAALSYRLGFVKLGISIAHGLTDETGNRVRLELGTFVPLGNHWLVSLNTSLRFADAKGMAYEFGVKADQALRRQNLIAGGDTRLKGSEARAYTPGCGVRDVALSLNVMYRLTSTWSLMTMMNGTRLLGEAVESPLVRRKDGVFSGIGLGYKFK